MKSQCRIMELDKHDFQEQATAILQGKFSPVKKENLVFIPGGFSLKKEGELAMTARYETFASGLFDEYVDIEGYDLGAGDIMHVDNHKSHAITAFTDINTVWVSVEEQEHWEDLQNREYSIQCNCVWSAHLSQLSKVKRGFNKPLFYRRLSIEYSGKNFCKR